MYYLPHFNILIKMVSILASIVKVKLALHSATGIKKTQRGEEEGRGEWN